MRWIIIINADNAIIYINPAFCSFLGYKDSSVIGNDINFLSPNLTDMAQSARNSHEPISKQLTLSCQPDKENRKNS